MLLNKSHALTSDVSRIRTVLLQQCKLILHNYTIIFKAELDSKKEKEKKRTEQEISQDEKKEKEKARERRKRTVS